MTEMEQPMHALDDVADALRELPQDWNGHGAAPIGAGALAVIRSLQIVPRSNGGIQIEWHANGQDIEVSVGPQGRLDGFTVEDELR